jgi:predicted RecA/RadA family phage recombinase
VKNFVREGTNFSVSLPEGHRGHKSGDLVILGECVGVAVGDSKVVEGRKEVVLTTNGVYSFPAVGEACKAYQKAFWDQSVGAVNGTKGRLIGYFLTDKGLDSAHVRLIPCFAN